MEQNKIIISYRMFLQQLKEAIKSIPEMGKLKKSGQIEKDFFERIMLAVTQVNGCALCSYEHTKLALEAGLSQEEIDNILTAGDVKIPEDEQTAILFAQHYAATQGNPSNQAVASLEAEYGREKASQIMAVIKMIMMGNGYGIAYGTLKFRLAGQPNRKSSLKRELAILATPLLIVVLPLIIIALIVKKALK